MKITLQSMAFIALLVLLSACLLPGVFQRGKRLVQNFTRRVGSWSSSLATFHVVSLSAPRLLAANIAEGTHCDAISKNADAAITTKFLLVKTGSDADHVAVAGASDKPLGVCNDEADAAEDFVNVQFLSASTETRRVVASEAIANDADLYTAANGKVQDEPAVAGTYYRIGKARSVALADGDVIEAELHAPVKVVVIAMLGNTDNEIGALTFSSTPTQAELNAFRGKCEELADDVRSVAAALATPAEVKVLTS